MKAECTIIVQAMTSYSWEMRVHGPVSTSRLDFFHLGFTPTVSFHEISLKCPSRSSSKTLPNSKFVRPECGLTWGHPKRP